MQVISQIRIVQAFVGDKAASNSYLTALQSSIRIGKRTGLVKGLGIGSLYGMGFASFSLLLWYAGRLVRSGDANGGVAFTTILNVIASSLYVYRPFLLYKVPHKLILVMNGIVNYVTYIFMSTRWL